VDDLLQPKMLDGQRGTRLQRQLAPGLKHPLPDLLRRHPLRPDRHVFSAPF